MQKTVYEFLKESKNTLNCMKPFVDMKSYEKIFVTYKIADLNITIHPSKACGEFDFYNYELNNLQYKGVEIKDCIFVSCEVVDKGLVIVCKQNDKL